MSLVDQSDETTVDLSAEVKVGSLVDRRVALTVVLSAGSRVY